MEIDAEQIKAMLLRRNRISARFRLPMAKEQAAAMLRGAVMAEVERRHRQFVEPDELTAQIDLMAGWLTDPKGKFCIILCGLCGNGKSTLVKALQQLLNLLDIKDEFNESCGLRIVDAKDVAWLCHDDRPAWNKLCREKMLAIDDLGTEETQLKVYGNTINPVIDMLYKRYDQQLFTVITTNLKPGMIREKYEERIADRLNEMSCRIVFENPSYRTLQQQ